MKTLFIVSTFTALLIQIWAASTTKPQPTSPPLRRFLDARRVIAEAQRELTSKELLLKVEDLFDNIERFLRRVDNEHPVDTNLRNLEDELQELEDEAM